MLNSMAINKIRKWETRRMTSNKTIPTDSARMFVNKISSLFTNGRKPIICATKNTTAVVEDSNRRATTKTTTTAKRSAFKLRGHKRNKEE